MYLTARHVLMLSRSRADGSKLRYFSILLCYKVFTDFGDSILEMRLPKVNAVLPLR